MWFTMLVVTLAAAICFAAVIAQQDRISARFGR
jgi:hypothetical protein